jgi:hypothetical protein
LTAPVILKALVKALKTRNLTSKLKTKRKIMNSLDPFMSKNKRKIHLLNHKKTKMKMKRKKSSKKKMTKCRKIDFIVSLVREKKIIMMVIFRKRIVDCLIMLFLKFKLINNNQNECQ